MNESPLIKFCHTGEIGQVMEFIGEHWARGHVLSTSKELMDFQHFSPAHDRYNFVLAHRSDGSLDSLLGFIPASKFDDSMQAADTIWLSLWKTRDDAPNKSIGLALLRYLEQSIPHAVFGTLGISRTAESIYRALRFETGPLSQYYLTNPCKRISSIAINPLRGLPVSRTQYPVNELQRDDFPNLDRSAILIGAKTPTYLLSKYASHPFYRYRFLYCADTGLVLVIRLIEACGSRVLRIIDAAGPLESLPHLHSGLERYVIQEDAEYIDILVAGLPRTILLDSGFKELDVEACGTIIPNYFEPFVRENKSIRYAIKRRSVDFPILLKGDADQDRPARIAEENI